LQAGNQRIKLAHLNLREGAQCTGARTGAGLELQLPASAMWRQPTGASVAIGCTFLRVH